MLTKTDKKMMKISAFILGMGVSASMPISAKFFDCSTNTGTSSSILCSEPLAEVRTQLADQYLTAYLITDAPLRLIQDTHQLWKTRLKQCKSLDCYKQQFDLHSNDLNVFISLNQSLTQHYLKFENGQMAKQPVYLKVHQLGKDRIKIEGLAYRSPNNRAETQAIPFLAYTTPDEKNEILDNEHDCKYQFNYSKAFLSVKSSQKGCERFTGIYRLYD